MCWRTRAWYCANSGASRGSVGSARSSRMRSASAAERRVISSIIASASCQRHKPQETRLAHWREHERRVDVLDLNAVEQQDHTSPAQRLERDSDLALGIERAPPLALGSIERALRLGRRDPSDQARRIVGVVVAFDLGRNAGTHDLACAHLTSLESELWPL